MRGSLSILCKDFIGNRDVVKEALKFESSYMYPICAAIITDKRKIVSVQRIKECQKIIKDRVGVFSDFRSYAMLAVIAMLSVDSDAEAKFEKAINVYQKYKKEFWGSSYLPIASMVIADVVEEDKHEELVKRTKTIYNMMKKEHPWLTSSEDSVLAALLSMSDKTDESLINDMEKCYKTLKPHFFSGNAVQSLSHALALNDESAEVKCEKVMAIFNELKSRGRKYGTGYELATLGVLASLPASVEEIVQDIIDVDDYLATQKGYGVLSIGKPMRLMHASMIVTSDYMEGEVNKLNAAAASSMISLVIAEQVAICAAISATAASSAANS